MRRLFIAILTLLATTISASAQKIWQGDMFITAVNDAVVCNAGRVNVGDFYRGVFRKGGLAGNPATDTLAFFPSRGAIQVAPDGGVLNEATTATVRYIFGSSGFSQLTGVSIAPTTVAPVPVKNTTLVVTISVIIPDIFGVTGCDATLVGRLGKRP